MNRHEWTVLGLRLLSIYLFLSSFVHFGAWLVPMIRSNEDVGNVIFYSVLPLAQCLMAALLWGLSSKFSHYIWKDTESSEERGRWSLPDIQAVFFSTVGLYVFVTTLPQLLLTAVAQQQWQAQIGVPLNGSSFTAQLINLGLRLLFSVWLMLGSEGIVRMLQKARTIGVQKS